MSVETCPHYLHFAAETIADGATLCKCAPPIRSRENREKLWQGLRDGVIDLVATDHSPCPPSMKQLEGGNFKTAWGGIASLSMALPVMWTEASARGFTLRDIARWMAEGPARLAGCDASKGRIAAGMRRGYGRVRAGGGIHGHAGTLALPARCFSVHGRKTSRRREGNLLEREARVRRWQISRRSNRPGISAVAAAPRTEIRYTNPLSFRSQYCQPEEFFRVKLHFLPMFAPRLT